MLTNKHSAILGFYTHKTRDGLHSKDRVRRRQKTPRFDSKLDSFEHLATVFLIYKTILTFIYLI